jgi:hypothetical protein
MYIYVYIYTHTHTHTHIHIYTYMAQDPAILGYSLEKRMEPRLDFLREQYPAVEHAGT